MHAHIRTTASYSLYIPSTFCVCSLSTVQCMRMFTTNQSKPQNRAVWECVCVWLVGKQVKIKKEIHIHTHTLSLTPWHVDSSNCACMYLYAHKYVRSSSVHECVVRQLHYKPNLSYRNNEVRFLLGFTTPHTHTRTYRILNAFRFFSSISSKQRIWNVHGCERCLNGKWFSKDLRPQNWQSQMSIKGTVLLLIRFWNVSVGRSYSFQSPLYT